MLADNFLIFYRYYFLENQTLGCLFVAAESLQATCSDHLVPLLGYCTVVCVVLQLIRELIRLKK